MFVYCDMDRFNLVKYEAAFCENLHFRLPFWQASQAVLAGMALGWRHQDEQTQRV